MTTRRVLRILLKLLTCTVGGLVAASVISLLLEIGGADLDRDDVGALVFLGAVIGLFSGISWSITDQKARRRFIVPPLAGIAAGGVFSALATHPVPILIGILLGFVYRNCLGTRNRRSI